MLQRPLAKQNTVADPDRVYPRLQLYVTVPLNVVLLGVPGNPFEMEGGVPQATGVLSMPKVSVNIDAFSHVHWTRG